MGTRFGLSLLLGFSLPAWGQLDSSSALLLRPSGAQVQPEDLDSTRYKIRTPESRKDKEDEDLEERPGTFIPSPVPTKVKKPKALPPTPIAPEAEKAPEPVPPPTPVVVANPGSSSQTPAPETPVSEQLRELILGGSSEDIEEVRKQLHPEDPRSNMIRLSLAPAYFYEGSGSEYSFRRYSTNGPGLGLGLNLWLTPFFGLESSYFSSFSSSVRSGPVDMVPIEVQTFSAGLRFRHHFGYTRRAAQMSWGLDYHDSHNKISRDSMSSVGQKTSGLGFVFEGVIPTSVGYAHTFSAEILPEQHQSELSTGVDVKSGDKSETNALSLSLGGEWTLDRRNQIFWKSQYSVERDLYQGEASTVDPHNGLTPNGVSVTNSLLIFYFGFKWGS